MQGNLYLHTKISYMLHDMYKQKLIHDSENIIIPQNRSHKKIVQDTIAKIV